MYNTEKKYFIQIIKVINLKFLMYFFIVTVSEKLQIYLWFYVIQSKPKSTEAELSGVW